MAMFICTNTCFLHRSKNGPLKELYQNIFVNVFVTRSLERNKELCLSCNDNSHLQSGRSQTGIHTYMKVQSHGAGCCQELGFEAITCLLAKDQERIASHISGLFEFNDHNRMGSHSHIRKAGIIQTACLRGSDLSGSGMYLKDRLMSWRLILPT